MIKTTSILIQELNNYANPNGRIQRLVKQGVYFPIVKGLYETDRSTPGHFLAASIYGPSYLSFEFALSYYDLIPETVHVYTSVCFEKRKEKRYDTPFGTYTYHDIPSKAYPFGVRLCEENGYAFQIASPEKGICDQLFKLSPVANQKELHQLLFESLRIDENEFEQLNKLDMIILSQKYGSTNLKLLAAYLKRSKKGV